MPVEPAESLPNLSSFTVIYLVVLCMSFKFVIDKFIKWYFIGPLIQRFFFKSQVVGTNKLRIGKCDDHVWVTKDELMEYFPDQAAFLNQMIISWVYVHPQIYFEIIVSVGNLQIPSLVKQMGGYFSNFWGTVVGGRAMWVFFLGSKCSCGLLHICICYNNILSFLNN